MSILVRQGDVWKDSAPHVKDSGVWKPVQEAFVKDAGSWKSFFRSGFTWTTRDAGFGTINVNTVTYANGLWIAGGNSGKLATSSDGINWTQRTTDSGTDIIRSLAYGNSLWVSGGFGGSFAVNPYGIATSPDGVTWTKRSTGISVSYV